MKTTYEKPQIQTIILHGFVLMLGGSNTVNSYTEGNVITVGDNDDPAPASNNNLWDNNEE